MKSKALFSIISISVLLSLLFSSCGGGKSSNTDNSDAKGSAKQIEDANVNPAGQYPICKEKAALTIGIAQNSFVKDYETNEFTKWLEEKSNIDLKFELFPEKETDYKAKLRLMVAGDSDLPDVLNFYLGSLDVISFSSQKAIIPLSSYIESYGVNTKDMLEKTDNKQLKQLMTMPDGNIYSLPRYAPQVGNTYSLRAAINKSWLDKLGLKMPTTTDEFYQVLKEFKTQDPNGNGKADEIPFIGSTNGWRQKPADFVMNAFIYDDAIERYVVNNGKVDVAYNKKEWQEGLKYLSKLNSEKLLSDLSFTQDNKQLNQIAAAGGPSTIGAYPAGSAPAIFPPNDKRIAEYVPLPPLKGPAGIQWSANFPTPVIHNWLITKNCKIPLAAFRLGDLMLSEDSAIRARFGVPEVDWKSPAQGEKGLYENLGIKAKVKPILQWASVQNSHWRENNPTFNNYFVDGMVSNGNPLATEDWIAAAVPLYMNKAPKDIIGELIFSEEEASEIATLRNNINTYVNEYIARFITGDKNPDTDWNAYIKEFDNLGLKKYLEISQQAYDRMNKK